MGKWQEVESVHLFFEAGGKGAGKNQRCLGNTSRSVSTYSSGPLHGLYPHHHFAEPSRAGRILSAPSIPGTDLRDTGSKGALSHVPSPFYSLCWNILAWTLGFSQLPSLPHGLGT